jgi:hypothetical protein
MPSGACAVAPFIKQGANMLFLWPACASALVGNPIALRGSDFSTLVLPLTPDL